MPLVPVPGTGKWFHAAHDTREYLPSVTEKHEYPHVADKLASEQLIIEMNPRAEVIKLEDIQTQVRKEYEMLGMEFEQNLAASEQTRSIHRLICHIVPLVQNHIIQLTEEVQCYNRKYDRDN